MVSVLTRAQRRFVVNKTGFHSGEIVFLCADTDLFGPRFLFFSSQNSPLCDRFGGVRVSQPWNIRSMRKSAIRKSV